MFQLTKKMHYAWIICVLGTVMTFVSIGVCSNGFIMYLPYLIDEYGFSNSQTSFLMNIRCLVSFVAMIVIAQYYRIFSLRRGLTLAVFMAALAFAIYATSENYIVFCVGAAVAGMSYGFGSMIPVTILINRWFEKSSAFALGICAMGSSFAIVFIPPIINFLIGAFSIKGSFVIVSGVTFAFMIIVAVFMRNEPEEKGLMPYGVPLSENKIESAKDDQSSKAESANGTNLKSDKRIDMKVWILIGASMLFMGLMSNPGYSHLSVLYTSEGYSEHTAAAILSVLGVAMALSKPFFGRVADHMNTLKACVIFASLLLAGYASCCFAFTGNPTLCFVGAICMGIGWPVATIGPSIWAKDLAPEEDFERVVKNLQILYAGGALVFASVPGIIADHIGSYIPSYILFSSMMAIAIVLMCLAYRVKK